jgi:hypothetical protein
MPRRPRQSSLYPESFTTLHGLFKNRQVGIERKSRKKVFIESSGFSRGENNSTHLQHCNKIIPAESITILTN